MVVYPSAHVTLLLNKQYAEETHQSVVDFSILLFRSKVHVHTVFSSVLNTENDAR